MSQARVKSSPTKFEPRDPADKKFADEHEEVIKDEISANKIESNKHRVECRITHIKDEDYRITTSNHIIKLRGLQEGFEIYSTKTNEINDTNRIYFAVHTIKHLDNNHFELLVSLTTPTSDYERIPFQYNYIGVAASTSHFRYSKTAVRFFATNEMNFKAEEKSDPRYPEIIKVAFRNLDPDLRFETPLQLYETNSVYKSSEQKCAIDAALNNYLTVIDGPPGAGKTHVLLEIVRADAILWNHRTDLPNRNQYKILVLCTQNSAADNCLDKLIRIFTDPMDVLRLNSEHHKALIKSSSKRNYCINSLVQKGLEDENGYFAKDRAEYTKLKEDVERANIEYARVHWETSNMNCPPEDRDEERKNAQTKQREAINALSVFMELRMLELIQVEAEVIVTTFATAHNLPVQLKYKLVLVDEAAFSTQQEIFQAAIMTDADYGRLVLFGDVKQLEPFYLSKSNRKQYRRHLTVSIPYLLIKQHNYYNVQKLMTQKRCVVQIANIMSALFYDNQIKSCDTVNDASRYSFKDNKHLMIISHEGVEEKEGEECIVADEASFQNITEVQIIKKVLSKLHSNLEPATDIQTVMKDTTVLTFYSAQKYILNGLDLPVTTSTVHSYQGKENRIVILSCVRQNDKDDVGFLDNAQLLNTAISRARDILIVITGSMFSNLGRDHLYTKLISEMRKNGAMEMYATINTEGKAIIKSSSSSSSK